MINSPIYLIQPRKTKKDKKYALNINTYRNLNFIVNNILKKQYKELMRDQLEWKVFNTPIHIEYTLYWAYKSDLMNVVSIVDKFFCDALTEYKCIKDDNIDYITWYSMKVWGKDRLDPRVEILIINK